MGICISTDAVTATDSTAKVILPDGRLEEFTGHVTASWVLLNHPSFFLCCADDMNLEGALNAVPTAEELEAGQIYFVLPKSMLSRRLCPEEMGVLAVRASASLSIGCDPYVSTNRKVGRKLEEVEKERSRRSGGMRRKFVAELSAIPE